MTKSKCALPVFFAAFVFILVSVSSCSRGSAAKLNFHNPFVGKYATLNAVSTPQEIVAQMGKPAGKTIAPNGNFSLVYSWGKMVYEKDAAGFCRLRMLLIEDANEFFSLQFNRSWKKKDIVRIYGEPFSESDEGLLYKRSDSSIGGVTFTFVKRRLKSILYANME